MTQPTREPPPVELIRPAAWSFKPSAPRSDVFRGLLDQVHERFGCETYTEWLPATSTTFAPIRFDMNCGAGGGIVRSSLAIR